MLIHVIVGSYTPFLLIGLNHDTYAIALLVALWLMALGGSIFSACSDLNSSATNFIEVVLYLSMSFGGVIVLPQMMQTFGPDVMQLILVMGAFYLSGIAFFVMGDVVKPIYHVVWHVFVLGGAFTTWFTVFFYVVKLKKLDQPF